MTAGIVGLADASATLEAAGDMEGLAAAELAAGVADITRGTDAQLVARRVARLSQVVAKAGVRDIAQGAELLTASQDLDVLTAAVGVMGGQDLESGLELGRVAGELRVAAAIMARLQMPVVAAFLATRGHRLTQMGVQSVVRAGSARALGAALQATGAELADLSAEDVAAGVVRLAAAEAGGEMSAAMSAAGSMQEAIGEEEVAAAAAAHAAAREAAAAGIVEGLASAEAIGEASAAR
jgi:hypothetical protein